MRLPTYLHRIPGLRTAKVVLAAVLSYLIAEALHTTAAPVLAPLTAILVVQLTVYETVAQGFQRILSVMAGVLIAVVLATFVGLSWWSLGAVVAVSLVLGQLLRLGAHALEVPISAMLILAVGGAAAPGAGAGRVYETLIGAATGVAVNFAVAPPVHVQTAGEAIGKVISRQAEFLRGLAGDLRGEWSRATAERWLGAARTLAAEVPAADRSLARAEQSALLNPRGAEVRAAQPRLRTALTGIEYCSIVLRTLCREIFDRTFYLPPEQAGQAYAPEVRGVLAGVLDSGADALCAVAEVTAGTGPADEARARVHEHLAELHNRRETLGGLLLVDPYADAAAWQQHGALLAAVDRLRVEIESSVRPVSEQWRPPPIGEGTRQAVRRVIDTAADETLPRIANRQRQVARRVLDVAAEAAAEAAANLATPDPRAPGRRTSPPDAAARAREAAAAAAVAGAAAEVLAGAAADVLAGEAMTEAAEAEENPRATEA
ncbi:aromatic acid exporter family protein [Actinoplanes sp. NPDC049681]|uniref:aromatic acid exporter family protein n=1 Tax=Actinoplanes sp. NPDC049681 TaxID=3363905 RepID=UPI0037BD18FC